MAYRWLERASRTVGVLVSPRRFGLGRRSTNSVWEPPPNGGYKEGVEYLMRSLEPIVGGKVDDDPRVPRPIKDGCDSAVEGAADEAACVQIPLVVELLENRGEQVFWDPFTDPHR